MSSAFTTHRGAARIVFARGSSARIAEHLERLGIERVLVLSSAGRAREAASIGSALGGRAAGVLSIAKEHVPSETAKEARREAEVTRADAVLAFGGGSAIGLAKAVALELPIRVVAIPTTYSGSEMTPIWGIRDGETKTTGRDERVRPALVVYDPELVRGLPRDVAVTSAWNAIAHAVEALWSSAVDPATVATASLALGLLSSSVARLFSDPSDEDACTSALEGAYLAGAAFADAGSGVHHRICHRLGGAFSLPHARTHAALLPHAVRAHRAIAPEAMAAIARALGVVDPVAGIERLARATGVLVSLRSLGMPADGVDRIVEASPEAERDLVRAILVSAAAEPRAPVAGPPLRAPSELQTLCGLGGTHESEALEGALPRTQNAPRRGPFGLYPELLNGTPFTVKSQENSRVWMYRIRASFSHTAHVPLPAALFAAPLGDVTPNRMRWRPLPMPGPDRRVDLLDGLVTLGGAGDPVSGPAWAVHLYAANADMIDRCLSNADGDLLVVPQTGTLDCRTELGWLRVAPGSVLLVPRALKVAFGLPDGQARGWVLEVAGRRLRLPERGLVGSNGLADARHFRAPVASYEDRACPDGFSHVTKLGGRLFEAVYEHSPFDVVAWHGNHAPFAYDLSLFSPMGAVKFDHQDPSIHTVLTAPLDDHGRAIADFVAFVGRWDVIEHSFRPPFMHRNAASELNMVVRTPSPSGGYDPGCTFLSPLLTSHGVATSTYDAILSEPDHAGEPPRRLPDESLWAMFESALPFRLTAWGRDAPHLDAAFLDQFSGMRSRFDPRKR